MTPAIAAPRTQCHIDGMRRLALALIIILPACTGETAKQVTSKAVGKAVEITKSTATGIAKGVQEGRAASESSDGAIVVDSLKALNEHGGVKIIAVRASSANADQTEVDLAFENKTDQPLRITKLEVMGLDQGGFAKKATRRPGELTVPKKAKNKLTVVIDVKSENLKTIRIYGEDLPVPAPSK